MSDAEDGGLPAMRPASIEDAFVDDGELLVYDTDNGDAWVQSSQYVEFGPQAGEGES